MLAILAVLLGVFAVLVTPREEEPQINVTMANVFVPFPGASAKEVESLISTPAEQVLSRIAGVEHVYSVSKPGMAVITVQYEVGQDQTRALLNLYDTVFSRRDWLSPNLGAGVPVIKPIGIDDVPIVSLTLWTADAARGAYDLERVAHALEIELKRIKGTREVATIGGPGNVVRVLLDAERLSVFGMSAQDVRNALQVANASQPSGSIVSGNREILVQTGTFLAGSADVAHLMIGVHGGKPVFLTDVAQVLDGPDLPVRYVWLGAGGNAGAQAEHPAVTVTVSKKPGENAVDIARAVMRRVEQLRGTLIPQGVQVTVTRNYGETANDKAQKLITKLVFATGSVVLLVLFALGRREAVVVGTAVMLTLAATLFASWAWGFTLNRVSLFALIFSIGILVDDAIVVVENIHRRGELDPGRSFADIIPEAVDEVGGPTILATFTVIAALLPMAFVTGLMGPYMSPIPINASFGMMISLAIAFIVTPWLSLRLLKRHLAAEGTKIADGTPEENSSASPAIQNFFVRLLTPFLRREQGSRKRRQLGVAIVLLIGLSVSLVAFKLVVLKMLPFDNKSEFQVVVDMPVGTPLEKTAAVLREMGAYLATVPEVTDYEAYVGTASPINFNGLVRQYFLRSTPELGDIQVNLLDKHHRSLQSHEIAGKVRPMLQKIAALHGADLKVVEVPPGPPVLSPLVAEVYGPDYDGQMRVAKQVRTAFEQTADIVFVDDSVEDNADKLVLRVLQNKAALMGVSQQDIVETMTMGLSGEYVTPTHNPTAKYEVPVRISLPPARLNNLDELLKLRVRARDGTLVPLTELVQSNQVMREKTIYHKDLLPVVYVVGDMAGKLDSPLYGMFDIRSKIKDMALADGGNLGEHFIAQPEDPYAGYSLKWDGEWQITYETFRDMGLAYAVGLLLIYLLVVAEFKSYLTPLIIMAPIPLTLIGVMPGHALLGAQFTATSMIGMIALAGIIVRNSILLVDFINRQVMLGVEFQHAVINAGAVRAKPIVLTGLAAMIGALFILDDPIFNGLAISLIFGILVSTLLTLVVIPVLYYAFNYKLAARN
ncbi:multidrug resistance protein MdtC [mine drainage metagenome]|uniref:Multidrug resistance protein MdtC n=1 Tax=mine drainage metagenome TaxID=410659 RepID=A0A1J5QDQ0_9ZZZZ